MNSGDIVTRSYFMNNAHPSAKEGNTPFRYLDRYMNRPSATEALTMRPDKDPILHARRLAWLNHNYSPRQISKALLKHYNLSWRSFSSNNLSCNNNTVKKYGRRFQNLFDNGHTLLKTIISFKDSYLKRMRVTDQDFSKFEAGSAFGRVDEWKLRSSIQNAVNRFTKYSSYGAFKNPIFMGTIQLDTSHPHCHLLIADQCPLNKSQRLIPLSWQHSDYSKHHKEERGKLESSDRRIINNSIDFNLNMYSNIPPMYYQDKVRNHTLLDSVDYITSKNTNYSTRLQELIASLPSDKRLWYFNSRNPQMKRPKYLMEMYLQSLISNHGQEIGYDDALTAITDNSEKYATPKLSQRTLYRRGYTRLHARMANAVYKQLRQDVSPNLLTTYTPFVDSQAQDTGNAQQEIRALYHGHPLKNRRLMMMMYRLNAIKYRYGKALRRRSQYRRKLDKMDYHSKAVPVKTKWYTSTRAIKLVRPYYFNQVQFGSRIIDKYRRIMFLKPRDYKLNHQLTKQRQNLMKRYHSILNQPNHVIPPKVSFKYTNQLLHDNSQKRVLGYRLHKSSTITFGQALIHYKQDLSAPIDQIVFTGLNYIGERHPQYRQITHELISSRGKHGKIELSKPVQHNYNKYIWKLHKFTDKCFDARLVNSNQLIDVRFAEKNPIIAPPTLYYQGAVNQKDFNQVKGIDIDECSYDFDPNQSRDLDDDTINSFDKNSHNLYMSALKARRFNRYIRQFNQRDINKILHIKELRHKRHLAKKLRKTHILPVITPRPARFIHNNNNHHFKTLSLSSAHRYNYSHLQAMSKASNDYITQVEQNPQILRKQYAPSQESEISLL